MQTESAPETQRQSAVEPISRTLFRPRLRIPLALVTLFWVAFFIVNALDKQYFVGFMYSMAAPALLTLGYFGWWLTNRSVRFSERIYLLLLIVGGGIAAAPLCDRSVRFGLLTMGVPVALTSATLWFLFVRGSGIAWRRSGLFVAVALAWGYFTLIRIDGIDANLRADTHWRWQPTQEELFLTQRMAAPASVDKPTATVGQPLVLAPGDWPAFRGPERDGVIASVKMNADWSKSPPRLLWKQRVGPSWSSVIVIGDRLFTQEQRDKDEAVVCYDALTGHEIWTHNDPCRFWDAVSGAGPRATPTFADGKVFTMGATGIVNCLDALTGQAIWSRNAAAEAGAATPMWGFSSSPLIVDGLAIVFVGGLGAKNLLAYHIETGEPAWTAPASPGSYSSPQLTTVGGTRQCLLLGDRALTSVDPTTGDVLWEHGLSMVGAPRTVQPHLVGKNQLLVGTLTGPGTALIEADNNDTAWNVRAVWTTTQLKPEFPDIVVHQGSAYGFDGNVFCCLDLATGNRRWKEGRYGHGQVMLLPDQDQLLVLSETGEAVLLAANPQQHQVLGRFQALAGKTWNHPVIAHGRLFARNAEEMACYEVPVSD